MMLTASGAKEGFQLRKGHSVEGDTGEAPSWGGGPEQGRARAGRGATSRSGWIHVTPDLPAIGDGIGQMLVSRGFHVVFGYHGQELDSRSILLVMHRANEAPRPVRRSWTSGGCGVIAACVGPGQGFGEAAVRMGYAAVMDCEADVDDLAGLVQAVLSGYTVLRPNVVSSLLTPGTTPASTVTPIECETLDALERRWLTLLSEGCSVVELAGRDGLSQRRVYRRLSATYRKLGVDNRFSAIAVASQAGQLLPDAVRYPGPMDVPHGVTGSHRTRRVERRHG